LPEKRGTRKSTEAITKKPSSDLRPRISIRKDRSTVEVQQKDVTARKRGPERNDDYLVVQNHARRGMDNAPMEPPKKSERFIEG